MAEPDYAKVLARIAKYHGAEVGRGCDLRLVFPCGNEIVAWKEALPPFRNHVDSERDFVLKYVANEMYLRRTNDGAFSDEFNRFGPRMLRAGSVEELQVKLSLAGF